MNEDEEEPIDTLDILSYHCTQLEMLWGGEAKSEEQKSVILEKYLEKVDSESKAIPEFGGDLDWFNVTEPLTFSDSLRGKIVILDFFTYCCINCMHILPDLKKLENLYSVEDGLVVVGVHSAKFENEKDSSNILSAVQRYDITHPVVNDASCSMWLNLKIKCWPTLLLLGPRGNPLFVIMGEGHYDLLEKYTGAAIKFYRKLGLIVNSPIPLNLSTNLLKSSSLKFPGKIRSFKTSSNENFEIFALSDSGNHRILIFNSSGDVLHRIGGKINGFVDGDFEVARFNSPQGIAFLDEHTLFVADTENHAIRKICLKNSSVETVVGTGVQGSDRVGGKPGLDQEISSPWDVICYKTRDMDMSFHMDESLIQEKYIVLIAMAGTHQIWALFLEDVIWWKFKKFSAMTCAAIVGNGHEENRNNSYPNNAAFAQPSGLAISNSEKSLFVADSESSSIRKINLLDGKSSPIAGGDRNPLNLFAFGDVDGKQYSAKFQHPLGLSYHLKNQSLYVADTYNHKIKKIDLTTGNSATCLITDAEDVIYHFNEPAGICINDAEDSLYICDTNNHTIEVVDVKTLKTRSLELNFSRVFDSENLNLLKLQLKSVFYIKPQNGKIKLLIHIQLQDNLNFTAGAPQKWNLYFSNDKYFSPTRTGSLSKPILELDITPPNCNESKLVDTIKIEFKLNLCNSSICISKHFAVFVPVQLEENGLDCIIEDINVFANEKTVHL